MRGAAKEAVAGDQKGNHLSKAAAGNLKLNQALKGKGDLLSQIPSIPVVLQSLLNELDFPADDVNLHRVAEIIGHDETLALQCLRMANSPLYSRGPITDSLRGAVRTLGISRTRDIAISCGMMRIMPKSSSALDPLVFWKHSLACAILSRKLARSVGFEDPEKAYLAGLLHDIGYIMNLVVFPIETKAAMEKARRQGVFAGEVEFADLGFTHCQSGEVLARKWKLPDVLIDTILCHHDVNAAVVNRGLVAIVSLADRLCRSSNLGLGYSETPNPMEGCEADWFVLTESCPLTSDITWSAFVKDSQTYVEEIHTLVAAMYQSK